MKTYTITEKQLEEIEHYRYMFELEATNIKELCSQERSDIEYGFQLGKSYSHLMNCFTNMMILIDNIKIQTIEN